MKLFKESIKKLYIKIIKYSKNIKFFCQYYFYKDESRSCEIFQQLLLNNEKILIIIPHADDEHIGCFKIINEYKTNIILYYIGKPDRKTIYEASRKKEIQIYAKYMGVKLYIAPSEYQKHLLSIIVNEKPQIIAVPSIIDWNEEHIIVINKVMEKVILLNDSLNILQYQLTVPIPKKQITHYLEMDKKMQNVKWRIFKEIYKTQSKLPYYRIMMQERISGKNVKKYSAEVYSIRSNKDWIAYCNHIINIDCRQYNILENLNNLTKIRKLVDLINNRYIQISMKGE